MKRTCPECGRVFDMTLDDDAQDWHYGHDCEAKPKSWNPRYVAYASANGNDPDDQLATDRVRYPGGVMTGFTLWIQRAWAAWRELNGMERDDFVSDGGHQQFDTWLPTYKEQS